MFGHWAQSGRTHTNLSICFQGLAPQQFLMTTQQCWRADSLRWRACLVARFQQTSRKAPTRLLHFMRTYVFYSMATSSDTFLVDFQMATRHCGSHGGRTSASPHVGLAARRAVASLQKSGTGCGMDFHVFNTLLWRSLGVPAVVKEPRVMAALAIQFRAACCVR